MLKNYQHKTTCKLCKHPFVLQSDNEPICHECQTAMADYRRDRRPKLAVVTSTMLDTLIQLVRPDKHQGSEAATTATRYLLALRKQVHP